MDKKILTSLLDHAMVKVAVKEFLTLSNYMEDPEWSRKVYMSLQSLSGLQQSIQPKYSDLWIALLYMTWYQPRQIQLAHLLIEGQKKERGKDTLLGDDKQNLHVIDFGCGTLAMQFAVVWAVTEALERNEPITSVVIDSYDANPAMFRLGILLWKQFKKEIQDDNRVNHMKQVIKIVEGRYSIPDSILDIGDSTAEFWLSAIHTTYPDNKTKVKEGLSKFSVLARPKIGLLTGHNHLGQDCLLHEVSPFNNSDYVRYIPDLRILEYANFPMVTSWRRGLYQQMSDKHIYLNREVNWNFANALGWAYIKND